jgi:hypothetical protein
MGTRLNGQRTGSAEPPAHEYPTGQYKQRPLERYMPAEQDVDTTHDVLVESGPVPNGQPTGRADPPAQMANIGHGWQ